MRQTVAIRTLFLTALMTLGSYCCTVSALQEESSAASQEKEQADDLPTHAVWRFGEWGENVGLNGYYRIAFSPDGRLMVARNAMNQVQLFDVQQRQILFEFTSYEDRQKVANFDFSPDSRYFLTAAEGYMEKITLWDTLTGEMYRELETDGKAAFFHGDRQVCVLKSREVRFYDVKTGKVNRILNWGDSGDSPITLSRAGTTVMAQRKIRRLAYKTQVIDVAKKTTTILDSPTVVARAGVVSPDGNWLAAVFNRQKDAFLWDLRDPHQKDRHKLVAHSETAQSVQFSPDSRFLATTGWDGDVYLWDVISRQQIGKLSGHSAHVNSCAFSPVDFLLTTGASGQKDNSIIFWDFRDLVFPSQPKAAEAVAFDQVWKSLSSKDHRTALNAVAALVDHADVYRKSLVQKVGVAAEGASMRQINSWIEELSSPRFSVRLAAENALKKSRMRAESILKATLDRDDIVLEVKYRITRILTQPIERPKIPMAEQHRLHRTIFALELMGTPEAVELLKDIAEAHSHVDIARDAASSLRRIELRQGE